MMETVADWGMQFLSVAFFLYVILVTVTIILDNRPPFVVISWLIVMYFLPFVGIVLYIYTGVNWRKRRIMKQLPEEFLEETLGDIAEHQREYLEKIKGRADPLFGKGVGLLLGNSKSVLTVHNEAELFPDGGSFFARVLEDIERAESSIHMQFFIWREDELGKKLAKALLAKAAEGVEVRLLFDGVGCFFRMSRAYKKSLAKGGIDYRYFLDPLNPLTGRLVNYRNHRKVIVIDGRTAYTGGMNVGTEYIDGGRRFKSWRDTGVRIRGEAVRLMQLVFLTDWYNSTGTQIMNRKYFPAHETTSGHAPLQLAISGPDSPWYAIKQLILFAISNAKEEVLIQSPYFIPDESILDAMCIAALSGVKVKLMMAGIPDKRLPFWVAQTYYEQLLRAGVEIHRYTAGFFHPKLVVADGGFATLGTCNMDVRSYHLDYEINLAVYEPEFVAECRRHFYGDLVHCRRHSLDDLKKYSVLRKFRNSLLRIVAPLL